MTMKQIYIATALFAALGAAQANPATYAIDPAHTFVIFEIGHFGTSTTVTLKANNFNCYVNPMLKREVCGGDFDTTIQRSLWGVNYGLNFGFPDTMRLVVQVEAIKQQ